MISVFCKTIITGEQSKENFLVKTLELYSLFYNNECSYKLIF